MRAATSGDPATVRSALERIEAPGWLTAGWANDRIGWIQRVPQGWGMGLLALFGWLLRTPPMVDPDRNGDGWLTIVIAPNQRSAGSVIDVRGEINERMDDAVWGTLTDLEVTVLDSWDPTDEVEDDILPGVV